jgi:aminopeptidase N
MRQGRDRALKEFRLVDEMPFCRAEGDIEEITSALNNVMVRRVDQGLLQAKRRRLASRKPLDQKEIDDVIVKALMRLSGAVQDCMAYEHQADVVTRTATSRRISRTVRDSKAKQLFRRKVLEETQTRTMLRQKRIERDIEAKVNEAAAAAVATRKEEVRSNKRERDRKLLSVAEQEFVRRVELNEEAAATKSRNRRIAKRASVDLKRREHRADVGQSLTTLRRGLDQLDSAADAMIHRRFVIRA